MWKQRRGSDGGGVGHDRNFRVGEHCFDLSSPLNVECQQGKITKYVKIENLKTKSQN